jgi:hypothetical protein
MEECSLFFRCEINACVHLFKAHTILQVIQIQMKFDIKRYLYQTISLCYAILNKVLSEIESAASGKHQQASEF